MAVGCHGHLTTKCIGVGIGIGIGIEKRAHHEGHEGHEGERKEIYEPMITYVLTEAYPPGRISPRVLNQL